MLAVLSISFSLPFVEAAVSAYRSSVLHQNADDEDAFALKKFQQRGNTLQKK